MYDFTYMWNLKKEKKKKAHSQIQRTDWVRGVEKNE